MDEKVFDVSMIYIQNTSAGNYSLEFYCRNKNIKLNFSQRRGHRADRQDPHGTEEFVRRS